MSWPMLDAVVRLVLLFGAFLLAAAAVAGCATRLDPTLPVVDLHSDAAGFGVQVRKPFGSSSNNRDKAPSEEPMDSPSGS